MTIPEKMLKAYFIVAERMNEDGEMASSVHAFHRTKKYAFFVEAMRLDENGSLPGFEELVKSR